MFGWLFRRPPQFHIDIHSHLLPGLDDGVKTYEEAIEILKFFEKSGFRKVITTPHIYKDAYPNTEKAILDRFNILQQKIKDVNLKIEVGVAAEYFVDGAFHEKIKSGAELLTWGNNYVLIETAFYNKPVFFEEVVFDLKSRGLTPILAHPERYHYLEGDLGWIREQVANGVLLQVNCMSLAGAYGRDARKMSKKLMSESLVSFLGSDIHRATQIPLLRNSLRVRTRGIKLLNDTIQCG